MGRKNVLLPVYLNASSSSVFPLNISLAANFVSISTSVLYQDSVVYQINITTSDSTGTFFVQESVDGVTYVDMGTAGTASGANDNILCEIDSNRTAPFIRIRYASSVAGTGTCTIQMAAKQVGG